jgi:hypothetical protein
MIITSQYNNGSGYMEVDAATLGFNNVAIGAGWVNGNWVNVAGFRAFSFILIFDTGLVDSLRVVVRNRNPVAWHTYGADTTSLSHLNLMWDGYAQSQNPIVFPFGAVGKIGEVDQFGEYSADVIYKSIRFEIINGGGHNFTAKLFCFA